MRVRWARGGCGRRGRACGREVGLRRPWRVERGPLQSPRRRAQRSCSPRRPHFTGSNYSGSREREGEGAGPGPAVR